MVYIGSSYIDPRGIVVEDGLNAIGDDGQTLKLARNALLAVGFVQKLEREDHIEFVLTGQKCLTYGQLRTMQNATYDALKKGQNVFLRTWDDTRETSIVEENNYNIAKITGYLDNNGDFAHGDYSLREQTHVQSRETEFSL